MSEKAAAPHSSHCCPALPKQVGHNGTLARKSSQQLDPKACRIPEHAAAVHAAAWCQHTRRLTLRTEQHAMAAASKGMHDCRNLLMLLLSLLLLLRSPASQKRPAGPRQYSQQAQQQQQQLHHLHLQPYSCLLPLLLPLLRGCCCCCLAGCSCCCWGCLLGVLFRRLLHPLTCGWPMEPACAHSHSIVFSRSVLKEIIRLGLPDALMQGMAQPPRWRYEHNMLISQAHSWISK